MPWVRLPRDRGSGRTPLRSACLPLHHGGSRVRARAVDGVLAVPQEGSGNLSREPWSGGLRLLPALPDYRSAPLLERRGDEAAAPYDDEGACEASGQVSAWYRLKLRSCGSCPGAPFQILKCHSMRSSAPASGHSSSLSCARNGSEAGERCRGRSLYSSSAALPCLNRRARNYSDGTVRAFSISCRSFREWQCAGALVRGRGGGSRKAGWPRAGEGRQHGLLLGYPSRPAGLGTPAGSPWREQAGRGTGIREKNEGRGAASWGTPHRT